MRKIILPILRFVFFIVGSLYYYLVMSVVFVLYLIWYFDIKQFKETHEDWIYSEEGGEHYDYILQVCANSTGKEEVMYYYKTPYDWLIKRKRYKVFKPEK